MQNGIDSNTEKKEATTDIIEKCIGATGRWQTWVFLLTSLVKYTIGWFLLSIIFLAPPVNFQCADTDFDKCAENCSRHIFDTSTFTATIVTEWNLVCENQYLSSLSQTVTMGGVLCGSMLFGYLSDRFGRKNPLVISIILHAASGLAAAFSPSFVVFLVMRFLGGAANGGEMVTSFVMIMEIFGAKWRTLAGVLYQLPESLGCLSLPLLSYYLRDWRSLHATISAPSIAFIIYYWVFPESPRWQLVAGNTQRAIDTLKRAAKYNKISSISIDNDISSYLQKSDSLQSKGNVQDLIRTPVMRSYTLIMCFNWIVSGFCFFGVSQFIGRLGGDVFVNVALSSLAVTLKVPMAYYMMNNMGRKPTLIFGAILSGVAMLTMACVPDNPVWVKTILALAGVLGIGIFFCTVYVYSGELFPTVVRNLGVGTGSTCARIGSMIAPFVADPGTVQSWIAPVIFGVMPLIAAAVSVKLPETFNCKLPDSVAEVEEFGKANKKGGDNSKANGNVKQFSNVSEVTSC